MQRIEYNFSPWRAHKLSGEMEPKYEAINNNLGVGLGWTTSEQKRLRGYDRGWNYPSMSVSPSLVKQLCPLLAGTTAFQYIDYISQSLLRLSVSKFCPMGWKQKWQVQLLPRILKGKNNLLSSSLPAGTSAAIWNQEAGLGGSHWWQSDKAGDAEVWLCIALPLLQTSSLHSFMCKRRKLLFHFCHGYLGLLSL